MGIFKIFEKKSMNHLENGELPWGWLNENKDFLEKIEKEYTYFLNRWCAVRYKSPKQLKPVLKSFVMYLRDVEKLCISKGECFEFWYYNIFTTKDYLNKRTKELEELENNFDSLQRNYESTHPTKEKIATLKSRVIEKLIENDGILQSDFWKMFDASEQESVKDIVYLLRLDGKIERVKSGRSFILHYKS